MAGTNLNSRHYDRLFTRYKVKHQYKQGAATMLALRRKFVTFGADRRVSRKKIARRASDLCNLEWYDRDTIDMSQSCVLLARKKIFHRGGPERGSEKTGSETGMYK